MNRSYISATSLNSLTISGPPTTLSNLFQSERLKSLRPSYLPISGPYHAAHIYNEDVITRILALPSLKSLQSATPLCQLVPILSSGKTAQSSSSNLLGLLESCIRDILLNPISWEQTLSEFIHSLRNSGVHRYSIVPVGTNNAAMSLLNASKQTSDLAVSLDEKFSIGHPGTPEVSPNVSVLSCASFLFFVNCSH